VATAIRFERQPWDAKVADGWRLGDVTNPDGADLAVVQDELAVNRLTYRYIGADSCALAEACVGGSGWRRLLQFNASEQNLGAKPVDIGNVDYFVDNPDVSTPNANHHVYEYSSCHHHYHFSHYATFTYGGDPTLGSKRAFCLESVARYSNNEHSPTWSPYGDCSYQGISQGWGDQYNAGIECQWVDVTNIDTSSGALTEPLGFRSNPDGFLCEGNPVLDKDGNPVWEPTQFLTSDDLPVDRPKCDFMKNWDDNNLGTLDVTLPLPGEGMTTEPCTRGQLGRRRNWAFRTTARCSRARRARRRRCGARSRTTPCRKSCVCARRALRSVRALRARTPTPSPPRISRPARAWRCRSRAPPRATTRNRAGSTPFTAAQCSLRIRRAASRAWRSSSGSVPYYQLTAST
jgi:hypothetical protein